MKYEDYQALLADIARKRSRTHEEFEDQMGVGHLAFLKAVKNWDPERGAFTTILSWIANNMMIDAYRKNAKHDYHKSFEQMEDNEPFASSVSDLIPIRRHNDPARIIELRSVMSSLGPEAKAILSIVGSSYEDVINSSTSYTPKLLRGSLTRLLRDRGFTWNSIYSGYAEIKLAVKDLA